MEGGESKRENLHFTRSDLKDIPLLQELELIRVSFEKKCNPQTAQGKYQVINISGDQ